MSHALLHHRASHLQSEALTIRAGGHGRILVSELSLHIEPTQRWVLLGPNGAGKSTLLATLAGLLAPAKGNVRLDRDDLARQAPTTLARLRAWCPQFWLDPFPVSSWETVACAIQATDAELPAPQIEQRARDWLTRLDVGGLTDTDVRTLSGGERQRVALATAFAQGAPLLLLDEPTSHLDWSHQALLQRLLKQWSADGGTVIAAVHDLNLAWNLATHVLLLDGRGHAIAGSREDVLQAAPLSHAYGIPVCVQEEDHVRWFRVDLSEDME